MDRELQQALELVVQPAFFAENGKIVWRNAAAAALLTVGMEISALLDRELLTLWNREDVLRFPAALGGTEYLVSVRTMPQGELFVAERRAVGELADRLTAASAKLRRPLHNMVSSAQTMFEALSEDAGTRDARAELNRALYQLLRLCGLAELYPKVRRDAIIIYGLLHGMDLFAVNDRLFSEDEETLF